MKQRIAKQHKPIRSISSGWLMRAYAAGRKLRSVSRLDGSKEDRHKLNELWGQWFVSKSARGFHWETYRGAVRQFIRGIGRSATRNRHNKHLVLLPTSKTVAAIISAGNEHNKLPHILDQLYRLPLSEIVIVMNGSSEEHISTIRNHKANPIVIHYEDPFGLHVGRALGAKASRADINLFLDDHHIIRAKELVPFIYAIQRGADIALNDITPYLRPFYQRDSVTIVKQFMNLSLGEEKWQANSLTNVPHAMSRRAVEKIGFAQLAVPAAAWATAIRMGLTIVSPTSVITGIRENNGSDLALGDHMEALHVSMQALGERLHYPDVLRRRQADEEDTG